jgi:hypothetical protein
MGPIVSVPKQKESRMLRFMMLLLVVCFMCLIVYTPAMAADPLTPRQSAILNAIEQVESGGKTTAIGDNGQSLGCMQIQRAYYNDAKAWLLTHGYDNVPDYETACRDRGWSRTIVMGYMQRYTPKAWQSGDAETIARVHNGGPAGASKQATTAYWLRVKRLL